MLLDTPLTTNIATTDITRAKRFYLDTLGLRLDADWGKAVRIDAGGAPLFIYQREKPPKADHTVASWEVKDIRAIVKELRAKGIRFEVYEGYGQDKDGIAAQGKDGPWAAWFKDPDGNTLGLTQLPK